MDKNNDPGLGHWVDDRMVSLSPDENWQPDAAEALRRLRGTSRAARLRRRWTWPGIAGTAACLCLLAFLEPRALAHRACTACLLAAQSLAAPSTAPTKLKPVADRKPAPEFALADASGKTLKLSDFRGKVVLLNFWATWCGGCKVEIPWFIEFQQTYAQRGFQVLGVAFDENGWEAVRPYIQQKKVNYPMMIGDSHLEALYGGVDALPVTMLIDQSGRIAVTYLGLMGKNEYAAAIEMLLKASHGHK